jgi:hypothetical protein
MQRLQLRPLLISATGASPQAPVSGSISYQRGEDAGWGPEYVRSQNLARRGPQCQPLL